MFFISYKFVIKQFLFLTPTLFHFQIWSPILFIFYKKKKIGLCFVLDFAS
ncbi:hypothetical protein HanIR_Chr02g0063721 [Helianthus annuus]|nr:hypothetical protein HanIR_Chr02g0063721 [Helianthus annuus]